MRFWFAYALHEMDSEALHLFFFMRVCATGGRNAALGREALQLGGRCVVGALVVLEVGRELLGYSARNVPRRPGLIPWKQQRTRIEIVEG